MTRSRPPVTPPPPVARGVGMPWDIAVSDPVQALAEARASLGDTFLVDSGPDRYLFTFSPAGVTAFYALAEEVASKGLADFRMLQHKLPHEIFAGRRTFPHELFNRDSRQAQLAGLQTALDDTVTELGDSGSVDVFALTRRLGHRVGLAAWGGPGTARGGDFNRLVAAFDVLDGAEAFVHPDAMAEVAASGKAAERAALGEIAELIGAALDRPVAAGEHPLFTQTAGKWDGEPPETRRLGVAYDVALVHIASMSNLFAALAWALLDLVEHPADRDRIWSGDQSWAEQCALESTRLAQRSIMSRYVVEPVELDTGDVTYTIAPGATIATLLPLTNTSAAPGLQAWEPQRWNGWRLAESNQLPVPELVTAFGHGRHTCPAQPFSLAAMTAVVTRLLTRYEIRLAAARPVPERAQIGGVARASEPCLIAYALR